MKRGLWLTLMVIAAIASVAWWNRIEIVSGGDQPCLCT